MPEQEVKVNYSYQPKGNDASQAAFDATVGTVQHPTVATLRYNWAILRRQDGQVKSSY